MSDCERQGRGRIFTLRRLSAHMPDFTTVGVGDTIKLSDDLSVVVLRVASSDEMVVRELDPREIAVLWGWT